MYKDVLSGLTLFYAVTCIQFSISVWGTTL